MAGGKTDEDLEKRIDIRPNWRYATPPEKGMEQPED